MSEARWVLACPVSELRAKGSLGLSLERVRIALFWHEGRPRATSNVCNHKGGPLAGGPRRGEFVTCNWHGWEYSVVTGIGPPGFEDGVPTYEAEVRGDDVWVNLTPATPEEAPAWLCRSILEKIFYQE